MKQFKRKNESPYLYKINHQKMNMTDINQRKQLSNRLLTWTGILKCRWVVHVCDRLTIRLPGAVSLQQNIRINCTSSNNWLIQMISMKHTNNYHKKQLQRTIMFNQTLLYLYNMVDILPVSGKRKKNSVYFIISINICHF